MSGDALRAAGAGQLVVQLLVLMVASGPSIVLLTVRDIRQRDKATVSALADLGKPSVASLVAVGIALVLVVISYAICEE